ncbi:MAG: hypothetical protein KDK70_03210 [Myxococcales bacterium]|nr:hypothetical protein [Myxococcales bacterium]
MRRLLWAGLGARPWAVLVGLVLALAGPDLAWAGPARGRPAKVRPPAETSPSPAESSTEAPSAEARTSSSRPRSSGGCDVIHGLVHLDAGQRRALHRACTDGPQGVPNLYQALFRLVSSSSWHAGVVATILRRNAERSLLVFADEAAHGSPPALVAQEVISKGLPQLATRCPALWASEELAELADAVGADDQPESLPFDAELATCLGVPAAAMEGTRLLTIRADGLEDVTVLAGTRDYVHAHRFGDDEALRLQGHRFFVAAVPAASPVAVVANHENLELPVLWRGLMGRHAILWATPPRRSCLDLSVDLDSGTHLYVDGVRVDGAAHERVCDEQGGTQTQHVDRTLTITFDRPGTGLPDHEITALTCSGSGDDRAPVVRHLSPVAATASSEDLRQTSECEALRLDLSTPVRQRVAVLGVTKLPGCEATPLWASDVQERARHILGQDSAHRDARDYANFSAYAEATEALSSLSTQLGGSGAEAGLDRGADTNALLGSAAQEAWRQGIDTLLSFALQCTPRGKGKDGEPQWAYSIRATSIQVSDLFARGYYGREGIDLEDFIDVESVGFTAADQQDASLGALLDRVFAVDTPRFTPPPVDVHYRRSQALRISRYFAAGADANVPEEVTIGYKAFHRVGRPLTRAERQARRQRRGGGPPIPGQSERPRLCERLVHRGARPPDAIAAARDAYAVLPADEQKLVLQRSRDELDMTSNPRAAVHEGELRPPRPGWYLITIKGDDGGEIEDAVCVHATANAVDLWGEVVNSGGPLVFAPNGARTQIFVRPRFGATWYAPGSWFGGGVNLGYGFRDHVGTRADWKDLGVSVEPLLRWRRHSLMLVSPHVEARSRATVIPVEFRGRFGAALDAGIVDIRDVDDSLVEFRRNNAIDTLIDFDLDLDLDLIIGAPVGPIQLQGIVRLTYAAVDDSWARSATNVTQDSAFYVGFGLGVSGGRR